jgi:hypothetical protein
MNDRQARRHALSEWLLEFSVLWVVFPVLDQLIERSSHSDDTALRGAQTRIGATRPQNSAMARLSTRREVRVVSGIVRERRYSKQ